MKGTKQQNQHTTQMQNNHTKKAYVIIEHAAMPVHRIIIYNGSFHFKRRYAQPIYILCIIWLNKAVDFFMFFFLFVENGRAVGASSPDLGAPHTYSVPKRVEGEPSLGTIDENGASTFEMFIKNG